MGRGLKYGDTDMAVGGRMGMDMGGCVAFKCCLAAFNNSMWLGPLIGIRNAYARSDSHDD